MNTKNINKVVLAYSGGLDTSVILAWLKDTYNCEIVTFTADIGQGEEVEAARAKAKQMGVKEIFIEDLTEEYVQDFVFPMFRANTVYEGSYLLGTSIARPLIAKRLVEIAKQTGADAISHGATGKGNDQVRFELGAYALNPDIKVIAPWREWNLNSREKLLAYAEDKKIPIEGKQKVGSPYSMDANLLHISYEGGQLEDPWCAPEESMWRWTIAPEDAPDSGESIELEFEKGDPIALNGKKLSPAKLLLGLNGLGSKHGIGRDDIVENRYVGMKSRGCYETPGGTILLAAHRAMESLTLDREVMPKSRISKRSHAISRREHTKFQHCFSTCSYFRQQLNFCLAHFLTNSLSDTGLVHGRRLKRPQKRHSPLIQEQHVKKMENQRGWAMATAAATAAEEFSATTSPHPITPRDSISRSGTPHSD